mmetsp:Transcript_21968/g.74690  ORF Transcript_21968/g.74690 Transcript_21968/m.74690 type:complete len:206 (-) Transcript_21968:109-726(-)
MVFSQHGLMLANSPGITAAMNAASIMLMGYPAVAADAKSFEAVITPGIPWISTLVTSQMFGAKPTTCSHNALPLSSAAAPASLSARAFSSRGMCWKCTGTGHLATSALASVWYTCSVASSTAYSPVICRTRSSESLRTRRLARPKSAASRLATWWSPHTSPMYSASFDVVFSPSGPAALHTSVPRRCSHVPYPEGPGLPCDAPSV